MVDLVRHYSNRSDLWEELTTVIGRLRSAQVKPDVEHCSVQSVNPPRVRLLSDRLSDDEVAELLASYQQGTTFKVLAEQFKISTTSVKKILKASGVTYRGHKFRN